MAYTVSKTFKQKNYNSLPIGVNFLEDWTNFHKVRQEVPPPSPRFKVLYNLGGRLQEGFGRIIEKTGCEIGQR